MRSVVQFVCIFAACAILDQSEGQRTVFSARRCRGRFFPGLGCFTLQPPFTNTNRMPLPPESIYTQFLLYTRTNPTTAEILNPDRSVMSSRFNSSQPTKILIHGFLQNSEAPFLLNMTAALLASEPMNVIVVGWGGGAGLLYSQAVANTRVVGAQIARLANSLRRWAGLELRNLHLIGHSLGAHVAGYAGARLDDLGRITALDPAQPNYSGYDIEVRLDPSDARFVDVIHTDAVPYDTVRGYGMMEPVGDVDFYPNGGHEQPGCYEDYSVFDVVEDGIFNGITRAETDLSCSHERSTELFTASIANGACDFKAFACESEEEFLQGNCLHCNNRPCPEMGLHASHAFGHGVRGSFYLNTTASEPFCGHHHFVTVHLNQNSEPAGTVSARLRGSSGQTEWTDLSLDTSGTRLFGLILSSDGIGEVLGVDIRTQVSQGYFFWSSYDPLLINRVDVSVPMRYPTKFFCTSNSQMSIASNTELSLNTGTYREVECPLPL